MSPLPHLPLIGWIAVAGSLGCEAGLHVARTILRLPTRIEAAWVRDARDVLGLEQRGAFADNAPDWIPMLSPMIVILTGLLTAVVVWRFGPGWLSLSGLGLTYALIALAGIDVRTRLLPDQITLPLLWLGLAAAAFGLLVPAPAAILGAVTGYVALWGVQQASRLLGGAEGMGQGDLKLLAALGAWMGPSALPPILLAALLLGIACHLSMVLLGRRARGEPYAFGPFLAVAGWAWFIAGHATTHRWVPLGH
ncbi:A24 family peptidase [Rhodanobacter sp. 115]|uniref:prepilin peptidase n=1 Tax=Rhodanobacter sp. FW021-MT20 TaxID=1162282 RepID=UPI0034E6100F